MILVSARVNQLRSLFQETFEHVCIYNSLIKLQEAWGSRSYLDVYQTTHTFKPDLGIVACHEPL